MQAWLRLPPRETWKRTRAPGRRGAGSGRSPASRRSFTLIDHRQRDVVPRSGRPRGRSAVMKIFLRSSSGILEDRDELIHRSPPGRRQRSTPNAVVGDEKRGAAAVEIIRRACGPSISPIRAVNCKSTFVHFHGVWAAGRGRHPCCEPAFFRRACNPDSHDPPAFFSIFSFADLEKVVGPPRFSFLFVRVAVGPGMRTRRRRCRRRAASS